MGNKPEVRKSEIGDQKTSDMKLDAAFRLSTYLTVAVASGCLAYAEAPYLPGIAFFALPLAALLVVAYWVEGKWSLSAQGANGLGLLISVGWVAWVIFFSDEIGRASCRERV